MRPDLSVAPERLQRVLVVGEREKIQLACCCIVANALLAHWHGGGAWTFFSRDNSYYAAVRTGVPPWYSRSTVVAAVNQLVADGFLEERRTAPSPSARYRSRFRAMPKLIEVIGPAGISNLLWKETPPAILRCRDDRRNLDPLAVLNEAELAKFRCISLDVEQHNKFLTAFDITLDHEVAQALPTGLVKVDNACLNPQLRQYYRVFNGDLRHGGRWYGPWWQAVPSIRRAGLRINGEPTIELDFAACQLRLLFARLGLPDPLQGQIRAADPALDLYSIEGVARDVVKLALLIVINASSLRSAHRALAARLTAIQAGCRGPEATRILGAVQRHFAALKPLWCSGVGLRLQREDSDVCGRIQRDMRAEGLPVLSIHDSFICWERAEAQLRAIMRTAFAQVWEQCENLDF